MPREETSFVGLGIGNGNGATNTAPARRLASVRRSSFDLKALKATDAPGLYWLGLRLYGERDHAEALAHFEAASFVADDARYWYFRALSERALGDLEAARASARRGNELERRGLPRADLLGPALERVPGPLRRWLREGAGG
jgi:hypothetical protein